MVNQAIYVIISRVKHAQGELKKKQSELKVTEKGYKKDKDAFDAIKSNITKLEVISTISGNFLRCGNTRNSSQQLVDRAVSTRFVHRATWKTLNSGI